MGKSLFETHLYPGWNVEGREKSAEKDFRTEHFGRTERDDEDGNFLIFASQSLGIISRRVDLSLAARWPGHVRLGCVTVKRTNQVSYRAEWSGQ